MSDVGEVSVKITADASGVDRAISNVKGQFSQLSNDLTGIAKGFNLDNVASQIDKVSDKFKGLGSTLAISAAPFEIYGALAVKAFSDFEKGIGKINTLLPDATKAEMEAVGEQLKAFSSEFGADINDAIQAYYDALSAGVAQGDVLPFMETAQKAGVAGMSDVSVAVDGLTSILNSYQKKTSEAKNVSDVMFKTVELGKIEFEQLASNIGKVAPTAAQFKIGFEDVGAAIASITSQGLKPEQTMTVLTSLISQLGKSGTDLSDKFKEITGQSFPDFIAAGGTLADAIGKIRDYSQDTGTSLMDMTGNLEAAKGLAMLGGSAYEQYAGFLDKISDSAGATDTAYSKMSETMAFAMDQLKAQMQTTLIEVGDALAPVVKDFTQWLSENSDEISDFAVSIAQNAVPAIEKLFDILKGLMDSFNNLPSDTKSILAQLLGVGAVGAAVGGPALYGAGIALGPVSSLVKLLGSLTVPATVATEVGAIGTAATTAAGTGGVGALTTALAALGGPVVLGAIAGVSIAIVAWETDFMGVRTTALDSAEAIFAGFQNAVSSSLEFIGGAAPAISEAFWGALSDPDYESQLIPNLQAVFAEATDTTELAGRAAAAAWIDNWNAEIASGRIKAPDIPDSQTASRTNTWINEPYPEDLVYVNGSFRSIPTGASVVNGSVYAEGAAQYAEDQKKLNELFAQFPTQQALASQQGTQTGAEAGTEAGAKAGVESLIPSLREYVEKQGKQGLSDADLEKYRPLYNKEYGLAAKATKEETEAKEKGTKELTNFSGSLEEATRAAIAANEKGSWTNNGKTYKINQNTGLAESQDLADIIAQNKQEASDKESAKAIKDSLKEQEKLFGTFADGLNPEKVADSLFSKYGSDVLTGKQIQIGDLLYNLQQNSKGGLNISGTDQASKEILNALNTIEATTKSLQTEQAKQTKTNKNGEITGGPDQSKISQYNSEIKAAQDILNKYGVSQTKGIQSTDLLNTSLDKTSTSASNLDKSVQTTGDNILNFSDPVKVATDNVFTFGPAVSSATEALLQVPGAIDKILNVESSAMDSLAESRSKQLQQDFDASVNASDLKKSITEYLTESAYWTTKTAIGSGHTEDSYIYQDNLKGDLLAQLIEMQNPVDFAPSGWARRTQASEWLSSQNAGTQTQYLQIVDDLMTRLEQIDFYEGVKSGKVKAVAEEGEVDIGHLSRRVDIVGLEGLNTGVEKTGTEAKTTTPQINTLNSAFEKIGLTGSGLSDVLSNVDQSLSDHHANILESKDYLTKYNDAAGENVKYTKDQEGQTKDLMNSLRMLGTAQNMYNTYMQDGVLDATESAHVQQALAAATKMMGDAGITAEGGISGLPGALQALASAAQAAMSQIQAAISQAQSAASAAASAAASGWKMQTSPTKYPTIAPPSPTNFTVNMNGNSFPAGTKPGDVIRDLTGQLRIVV